MKQSLKRHRGEGDREKQEEEERTEEGRDEGGKTWIRGKAGGGAMSVMKVYKR